MSAQADGKNPPFDPDGAMRDFLTYVLLPTWVLLGTTDWAWHRATKIERTAGAHESLTHLLMGAEAGTALMLAVFFEIDAGIIAAMLGAAALHEATVVWDVTYARSRRRVYQGEQHTHSFLEAFPFMLVAVVAALHPEHARAFIGLSDEPRHYNFRLKKPLPPLPRLLAVGVGAVCGMLPHIEEFVRCIRTKPTIAPLPPPPEPPNK